MIFNQQGAASGGGGGGTHTVTCTGGKIVVHSTSTSDESSSPPAYDSTASAKAGDIVCCRLAVALKDGYSATPTIEEYWQVYFQTAQYYYFCFIMPDSDVTLYAY